MAVLQYLESLRNAHLELSERDTTFSDLYQRKLWHQLTLKLEQFVALVVFQDLVFDLSLSALLGEGIYNFGELLAHPISVLGIILGGGAGTRLYPLTKKRAKPAVPLGANYRLIDIPVSNCLNSNIIQNLCPHSIQLSGMPTVNRRKDDDEGNLKRSSDRITCGKCGEVGHNKRICQGACQKW